MTNFNFTLSDGRKVVVRSTDREEAIRLLEAMGYFENGVALK